MSKLERIHVEIKETYNEVDEWGTGYQPLFSFKLIFRHPISGEPILIEELSPEKVRRFYSQLEDIDEDMINANS